MQTLNTYSRNINCNHLNFCNQVIYEGKSVLPYSSQNKRHMKKNVKTRGVCK